MTRSWARARRETGRPRRHRRADRVVLASHRARQTIDGIAKASPPPDLLTGDVGDTYVVAFEVEGRRERLVYLA
jgi:hypothetical protein